MRIYIDIYIRCIFILMNFIKNNNLLNILSDLRIIIGNNINKLHFILYNQL